MKGVSGIVGGIGGFSGRVSGIVGGIGGFSEYQGEMAEGIGGKGVEFHYKNVGNVWRFDEEGGRKGGSGLDSSVESQGTEEVCRIGHGGIDSKWGCRNRSEGCRVYVEEETSDGAGGLRNCNVSF